GCVTMAHFDTDYQRLEASYSDSPPGEENLLMHVPEGAKCMTFILHAHLITATIMLLLILPSIFLAHQLLFVVGFTVFLANCVDYDILFANKFVNHVDSSKVTLPDAFLPMDVCNAWSFIPDKNMVCCPEQLLRVILAHIHYMPDHWQGNAHRYETRDQFSQLFQYKAVFILEELLSPVVTPIILIFCLRRKSLEIIDFFRNFTVEVVGVGDTCSFAQMDIRQHGHPAWMSEGKTEASIYQQAEDGKTELSLMHFAITNPQWQPPRETTHFISQLKERVHREATGSSSDTHPLSLSEFELHKQQSRGELSRHTWHRQESDESSDSVPDEVRSEPTPHCRNFPRSYTFPVAVPSPSAIPGSASTARSTSFDQEVASSHSSAQRRQSDLTTEFCVAGGKVVRTMHVPMGGWAENSQATPRHHEPVPEESSEDEMPPHVHKKLVNMPRNQSLASFQQKRAKGDIAGASKKTQKRKGQAVTQIHSTTQDCPVKSDSCQAGDPNLSKTSHEQLQQAVEKRNEIIARLSFNLQEALARRDEVQLEAQSLAGQIKALQKQLQQKLRTQLEEERQRSKSAYADLALEIEKHQHVLSLLEVERKGREEEREEKEMQLQELQTQFSSIQSQCLELQQDKAEKEKLNREVLELKERLQMKEDAESILKNDALGTAALHFQALEEIKLLKEEHRKEVEKVNQLLSEREKELKFREEEVMGLKASKNQQNQAKAEKGDGLVEEQHDVKETALSNGQEESKLLIVSVPEAAEASKSAEDGLHLSSVGQIQALQVTEREHERMISELNAKHSEELNMIKAELRESLEAAHQAELQQLQELKTIELEALRQSLSAMSELEQAQTFVKCCSGDLEDLVSSHKTVLQQKGQQALHLEEKAKELQKEVLRLQEEKKLLKQNSEEEVGQLWTQLESMRASRQELGELKEQLLARSSRVDDLERLKAEFNNQKREIKEQNEAELESLRRYFEQRLRVTEENYREDIALLQLRLVRSKLTEHYYDELQEMKSRHALELEQLKAKLSERHLQGPEVLIIKQRLEAKYDGELTKAKSCLTTEMKELTALLQEQGQEQLCQAQERFKEEKKELEQRLTQKCEICLALRDEMVQLENKHQEELSRQKSEYRQLIECHTAEQLSFKEALKKEQAQVHMEKFSAMAAELSHLHKTGFEEQKQVELEDLRRSLASEQEDKEQSYTDKMNQLTAQLQQLDAVVAQLQTEIGCLQEELKGKRAQMETLDTLLQRRERESQEGGNLLKMLTDDLQSVKQEKHNLDRANEKFKKVLVEMIRGTIAIEELIGRKLNAGAKLTEESQRNLTGNKDLQESDPELTHMLCESLLVSDIQISPDGEEAAQNACARLRQTVETLLDLLNQANAQVNDA
ncbi:unnamed protein product, partial [Tetraodon nigroviridis]